MNLIIIGTLFILGIIIGFCGGYMYSQGNTINNTTNNTTILNTTDTKWLSSCWVLKKF